MYLPHVERERRTSEILVYWSVTVYSKILRYLRNIRGGHGVYWNTMRRIISSLTFRYSCLLRQIWKNFSLFSGRWKFLFVEVDKRCERNSTKVIYSEEISFDSTSSWSNRVSFVYRKVFFGGGRKYTRITSELVKWGCICVTRVPTKY